MEQSLPVNFTLYTLILFAQTLTDFLIHIYRGTSFKYYKFKFADLLVFIIGIGFVGWVIYFFDYGFRALVILLQGDGGLSSFLANSIVIAGYYFGYNLAKYLDKTRYQVSFAKDDYIGHLFGYSAIAFLTSFIFSLLSVYIKNFMHL